MTSKNIGSIYSNMSTCKYTMSKINFENIKYYSILVYNFLYAYCEYCVEHNMI